MKKVLTIDPSGTGTTGIFIYQNDDIFLFEEFKNKEWKKHIIFIIERINLHKPNIVIYENTTYIHRKVQGSLNLLKLIGAIDCLRYFLSLEKLISIAVNQVKKYKIQLWNKTEKIEGLEYLIGRGRGWQYKKQKINLHQLDALIIFNLWKYKNTDNIEEIEQIVMLLKQKKRLGKKQQKQLEQFEIIF